MNLIIQQARQDLNKRDWEVKKKALESLSDCGDPDALALFEEFLSTETDRDLTAIAVECKSRLERVLEASKTVNKIEADQEGDDDPHRSHLAPVYDGKTLDMVQQLENEDSKYVRATLVKELGKTKDPSLIKVIAVYLYDPDARVVANTVEALGMMKSPVILQYILPLIDHQNPRVKANVNKILYRFDADLVLSNLREMIVSTKERVRASAVFALTQNPSVESLDILLMGRDDPSTALKARIAKEIVAMKATLFLRSLKDPKKLSLYLFATVTGIFFIYFGTVWGLSYYDSLTSRNRFATAVSSGDDEDMPGNRRGSSPAGFTLGRRIVRDPFIAKVYDYAEGVINQKVLSQGKLLPGLHMSPAYVAQNDYQIVSAKEAFLKGDLKSAEQIVLGVLENSEDEYVLFNAYFILIHIFKQTSRSSDIGKLMQQIEQRCPNAAKLPGNESLYTRYEKVTTGLGKIMEMANNPSSELNSQIETMAKAKGLSSSEISTLKDASKLIVENMMGGNK